MKEMAFQQKHQKPGIFTGSRINRKPPSLVAHSIPERVHIIAPLASLCGLQKDVERLRDAASDFEELLTDTTEQFFPLRAALGGVLKDLRIFCNHLQQGKTFSGVPHLVVFGARHTGRSTLVNFLLERSPFMVSVDSSVSNVDDEEDVFRFMGSSSSLRGGSVAHSFFENNGSDLMSRLNSTVFGTRESLSKKTSEDASLKELAGSVTVCNEGGANFLFPKLMNTNFGSGILGPSNCSDIGATRLDASTMMDATSVPQTLQQSVKEIGRHRQTRDSDDSKNGRSVKDGISAPFLQRRQLRHLELDLLSTTSGKEHLQVFRMTSGGYNFTIADRIRMQNSKSSGDGILRWNEEGKKLPTLLQSSAGSNKAQKLSLPSSSSSSRAVLEFMDALHASSWTLQESNNTAVFNKREVFSSCQLPCFLRGDAFILTLPCDVIGTHLLPSFVTDLFGRFVPYTFDRKQKNVNSARGTNEGAFGKKLKKNGRQMHDSHGGDNSNDDDIYLHELRNIRQMIADMTLFCLTFSDTIILRADGAVMLDRELRDRPPPMASNLVELRMLFQKDMLRFFGVQVAPWQVIPYSGTVSHITRDVLMSIHGKRLWHEEVAEINNSMMPFSPKNVPPSLPNSSILIPRSPLLREKAVNLQSVLHFYCDVVYGQRFKERKHTLLPEQLEKMVGHHALTTMWDMSGASQILHAAQMFERCAGLHFLSCVSVSLSIWCFQFGIALERVNRFLSSRIKRVRREIRTAKKKVNTAALAIKHLKEGCNPRMMVHNIQLQFLERFEVFTVTFWWDLFDLLNAEDNSTQRSKTPCPHPQHLSLLSVQARERLLEHYRRFIDLYVEQDYPAQISQLQRIIAEESHRGVCVSSSKVDGNGALSMSTSGIDSGSLCSSTGGTHHIPFVAQSARELKATMEKELTLHLSRFNTEVINYFMAEMQAAMPAFVEICDQNCRTAEKVVFKVAEMLNSVGGCNVRDQIALRCMLCEISKISLVELQPNHQLELFVTGMRSALCEDQILFILKKKSLQNMDFKQTKCAARTVKYIAKSEACVQASQSQNAEFMHSKDESFLHQMRDHSDRFLAPMEMEKMTRSTEKWLCRTASVPGRHAVSSVISDTDATATVAPEGCCDEHQESHMTEGAADTKTVSSSTVGFLLAIWKETLSSLSFRPWLVFNNSCYASLLNNLYLGFLKCHARLVGVLEEEISELEVSLCNLVKEARCTEVEIPALLKRLDSAASTFAGEAKAIRSDVFTATFQRCKVF